MSSAAATPRNAMVELTGEFREVKNLPSTLNGAENAIRDAFGFGSGAILLIQWVDDDGDTITVSSNEEWAEALNAKTDLSLTVKASGDLTIVRNEPQPEPAAAEDSASKDEAEEWIVIDPSEAASARNSVTSEQAAAAASEAAREEEEKLKAEKQVEEQRLEQERKDREELERRAQLEAEDLRKAQEMQEEENRRAEEQRRVEAADALKAAAEAEAIAASSYDLVHPPRAQAAPAPAPAPSGAPAGLGIDAEAWLLVKQLEEMGFGHDYAKLSKVLTDHRMDVTSAIEALAAEAAVAEGESGPRVAV